MAACSESVLIHRLACKWLTSALHSCVAKVSLRLSCLFAFADHHPIVDHTTLAILTMEQKGYDVLQGAHSSIARRVVELRMRQSLSVTTSTKHGWSSITTCWCLA